MPLVYNHSLAISVLIAQQFMEYSAETLAIHGFHMYVCQPSMRQTVYQLAVPVHPSSVQQFVLVALANGLNRYIETLFGVGIVHRYPDIATRFSVQHIVVVFVFQYRFTVYLLNDAAFRNPCFLHRERSTIDNFLDFQPISIVCLIVEQAQGSSAKVGTTAKIASTCV